MKNDKNKSLQNKFALIKFPHANADMNNFKFASLPYPIYPMCFKNKMFPHRVDFHHPYQFHYYIFIRRPVIVWKQTYIFILS